MALLIIMAMLTDIATFINRVRMTGYFQRHGGVVGSLSGTFRIGCLPADIRIPESSESEFRNKYFLRRTQAGDIVLHAIRADNQLHRSYRVGRIQRVRTTHQIFTPRYAVE